MPIIYIIGAGQLGSRHLQALQSVEEPLTIRVIDTFEKSLATAKERFEAVEKNEKQHTVSYSTSLQELPDKEIVDIAIIATNSDVRKDVVKNLLEKVEVRFMILEKLLFTKKEDFGEIKTIIKKTNTTVWVNCSMRTMPFYKELKKSFSGQPLTSFISGSQFGLVTNAIHYLDYVSYLTDCYSFSLDTSYLDTQLIPSKRKGFQELTGTLIGKYTDGSFIAITCSAKGDSPVQIELANSQHRFISREPEKKAWASHQSESWVWHEIETEIPYQSQMTANVVRNLLKTGECDLTPYDQSVSTHLALLEPLQNFLQNNGYKKFDYYPFT